MQDLDGVYDTRKEISYNGGGFVRKEGVEGDERGREGSQSTYIEYIMDMIIKVKEEPRLEDEP